MKARRHWALVLAVLCLSAAVLADRSRAAASVSAPAAGRRALVATAAGARNPIALPVPTLSASAPVPSPTAVSAALVGPLAAPALGSGVAVDVADLTTGRPLFARNARVPMMPASVLKFAVTTAALSVLGPDHRLVTRVQAAGSLAAGVLHGDLVLVGGGDELLSSGGTAPGYPPVASLTTLAAEVRAAGVRTVTGGVRGDASLFSGPGLAPDWYQRYVTDGSVTPVSALETNDGLTAPAASVLSRPADPALLAAQQMRAALLAQGVQVLGGAAVGAGTGGPVLASVASPPLSVEIESMLARSDNDIAEVLGRLVARQEGDPATFAGAATAIPAVLRRLGVDTAGLVLYDASGLSRQDRIPAALLLSLLRRAASPAHPQLRALLTGLPVAGFRGTLQQRFGTAVTAPGAGVVHAKTGTLRGVSSLAGTVVDRQGRELVFVAITNTAVDYRSAESALDRVGAALAQL